MSYPDETPPQFGLKHAMIAFAVLSVWLAVMRQPTLRPYGDIATLLALVYYTPSGYRRVVKWIRGLAERGVHSLASAVVAATIGSAASLVFAMLLIDIHLSGEQAPGAYIVGLFALLLFWLAALAVCLAVPTLILAHLFRQPPSIVLVIVYHVLCATIGAAIFAGVGASLPYWTVRFHPGDVPLMSLGLLGGAVGFVFGSSGFYLHLDWAP